MRLFPIALLVAACATPPDETVSDTNAAGGTDDTSAGLPPPASIERYCTGRDWLASASPVTLPDNSRSAKGYLTEHGDYTRGTVESSKFVPEHPFHVTTLRVQFAEGQGKANLRLMGTQGRSYPAGYPDLDTPGATIAGPFEVEVSAVWGDEVWTEVDVSALDLYLLPGQHYTLVNEYPKRGAPTVAFSSGPTGENSRALLILAGAAEPYGFAGDFLMELVGEYVCAWEEPERWFGEWTTPFGTDPTGSAVMTDLNVDGHLDMVTYGAGPRAWLGDGTGAFANATTPWPEATYAGWLLFGDVDNDGDPDAYAASYITPDADGDGITVAAGDCDDIDAATFPGASELSDGIDNDCDGIADDGTDGGDADGDGVSILAGDCDDTDGTTAPDLAELKDQIDNDCDGLVDEDFPSRLLLNDGAGSFTALPGAGVEFGEPNTAGAFADADGNGALDLYVGNWLLHYPDDAALDGRYFQGVGDGSFVDALDAAGLRLPTAFSTYGVEWTDYNNDGAPDLLVANYHLYDNQLWENQGDGTFIDVAAAKGVDHDAELSPYTQYPGGHSYGGDFGDIDNDGDMDYFQSNLCHPRTYPWADQSTLNINGGAPDYAFTNESAARGLEYDEGDVQGQFGDYDNDGDLDLLVSSLYPNHYPRVYQNDGDGSFTDVTYEVGLAVETSFGILWGDVDEDGDLDFYTSGSYGDVRAHLFENRIGTLNHWVELDLEGTTTNRDAAGARVTVVADGVTRIRDVQVGGGSFNQQRPLTVHLGLGASTEIESVTVHWVGGATETFTGVTADARLVLVEGSGAAR